MSADTVVAAAPADVPAIRAVVGAAYSKWIPLIGRKPMPMAADCAAAVAAGHVWVLRDGAVAVGVLVLVGDRAPLKYPSRLPYSEVGSLTS